MSRQEKQRIPTINEMEEMKLAESLHQIAKRKELLVLCCSGALIAVFFSKLVFAVALLECVFFFSSVRIR